MLPKNTENNLSLIKEVFCLGGILGPIKVAFNLPYSGIRIIRRAVTFLVFKKFGRQILQTIPDM